MRKMAAATTLLGFTVRIAAVLFSSVYDYQDPLTSTYAFVYLRGLLTIDIKRNYANIGCF